MLRVHAAVNIVSERRLDGHQSDFYGKRASNRRVNGENLQSFMPDPTC